MADSLKKRLLFDPAVCSGCLNCATTCAQQRSGLSGLVLARLRVEIDLFGGLHDLSVCRQCDVASCAEACPNEAFVQSDRTRSWRIDPEKCVDCLTCVDACSFDSLFVCQPSEVPLKCDLCEGVPLCAEACAFGALRYDCDPEHSDG
jgi:Fe-S-cluster-containing hydrogenase component 2